MSAVPYFYREMKIGLFFGSFNPIHNGHLFIANVLANCTDLQKVWLVVSPQNPLKDKSSLLPEYDRLHLVNLAIENNSKLKASSIEFKLPRPSYTVDTLAYLQEKYPQHEFSLIMGSDNLASFTRWKNYEVILKNHTIYVYGRKGNEASGEKLFNEKGNIKFLDFPFLDISSSQIREMIKEKKPVRYLLPESVEEYIRAMKYYK